MTLFNVSYPFVGRESLLGDMGDAWERMRGTGIPCRLLVHGAAGIGSSSLAAVFAGRLEEHFPDGVLYLPVGDSGGGGPMSTGGLLRSALIQLGIPVGELPDSEPDQVSVYRRLTAGKSLLIIFDGVSTGDQIARLVPNSDAAVVIATTRRELRTLITQGWRPMRVPALDPESSRVLLRTMLDVDFDAIDPATVMALLQTCAGHPLALRIVGGVLAGQPEYATRLVADVGEVGIDALEVDGVPLLRTVLDSVYDSLSDTLQVAYRRLAANPGPDFSISAAEVLLAADSATAQRTVRSLTDANLLERGADHRIRFHPLVRDHARLKGRDQPADELRQRQLMIIGWYRDTAVAWESGVSRRWRESAAYAKLTEAQRLSGPDTRQQALGWLTAERANLECAVTVAVDIRADDIAVDLGFVLWTPFHLFGYTHETVDAFERGVAAARRLGDHRAAMQLTSQLGSGCFATGDYEAAERYFTEALTLAKQLQHGLGQQSAHEWLGKIAAARARLAVANSDVTTASEQLAAALDFYRHSEVIARTPGMIPSAYVARVLALLALHRGRLFNQHRSFGRAAEVLPEAVRHFEHTGEGDNHAKALYAIGQAALGLGDVHAAWEHLTHALILFEADGSLRRRAETHAALASAIDDRDDAVAHLRSAEDIYTKLGDARVDDIRRRLAAMNVDDGNPR